MRRRWWRTASPAPPPGQGWGWGRLGSGLGLGLGLGLGSGSGVAQRRLLYGPLGLGLGLGVGLRRLLYGPLAGALAAYAVSDLVDQCTAAVLVRLPGREVSISWRSHGDLDQGARAMHMPCICHAHACTCHAHAARCHYPQVDAMHALCYYLEVDAMQHALCY